MKIRNLRWYIAALLFVATVINYIDRQTMSIVAPVVTKQLHITPIQYSEILQAFLIAYTLMYLGSGFLVDRWGTRTSLAAFMSWWSVSDMLHALVRSAFGFGFFRFLLGVGEPGNFMAALKATSEWYPAKEKAFVNGLVNAGASVGAIIAAPLVVWITLHYGWRSSFVVTGCFGFVWMVAWLWFYRTPDKHPRITAAELAYIRAGAETAVSADGERVKTADLLGMRQTWGLLLARFISDPVWWFYLFWLPKYLFDQRGFTLAEIGMFAWVPYLCSDLGSVAGGLLSGFLIRRSASAIQARLRTMLPCALLMPLSILIALTPSAFVAIALICVVTFSHMAWKTALMTLTNDIYPVRVVGSVSGIIAFGSGLGGTLFTSLTGFVVQHFSYTWIFVVMGFLHPIAYVFARLLVGDRVSSAAAGVP
jgi:MFS transporter, ACS family, aldohexuronate transporter